MRLSPEWFSILDLNSDVVRQAKEKGEKINFGDATRREVLHHAHIDEALTLVFAMSDPQAARHTVKQARQMNPNLHIIVRTRYISEITELPTLGENQVIPEEFETSIEIFSRILECYGIDRATLENQIKAIRRQVYKMLRSPSLPVVNLGKLNSILKAATTETAQLEKDSPANGKTLAELNLRGKTGATLIAVIHNDETKINPGANYRLCENDILVLLGTTEKIERAINYFPKKENQEGM